MVIGQSESRQKLMTQLWNWPREGQNNNFFSKLEPSLWIISLGDWFVTSLPDDSIFLGFTNTIFLLLDHSAFKVWMSPTGDSVTSSFFVDSLPSCIFSSSSNWISTSIFPSIEGFTLIIIKFSWNFSMICNNMLHSSFQIHLRRGLDYFWKVLLVNLYKKTQAQ